MTPLHSFSCDPKRTNMPFIRGMFNIRNLLANTLFGEFSILKSSKVPTRNDVCPTQLHSGKWDAVLAIGMSYPK